MSFGGFSQKIFAVVGLLWTGAGTIMGVIRLRQRIKADESPPLPYPHGSAPPIDGDARGAPRDNEEVPNFARRNGATTHPRKTISGTALAVFRKTTARLHVSSSLPQTRDTHARKAVSRSSTRAVAAVCRRTNTRPYACTSSPRIKEMPTRKPLLNDWRLNGIWLFLTHEKGRYHA
jgi:hypothetical protein